MTNETTASQPKSIGDDAQFMTLLNEANYTASEASVCGNDFGTGDKAQAAEDALITYIDSRAPAAQASATIQAAPGMHAAADLIDAKAQKYLDDHADIENDTGAVVFHYGEAGRDYHSTLVELAEELRSAATIQEPVMVAEPVGEVVLFGGDLKEVSWAKGKMPAPGTKLYAAPMVADPAGLALPVDRDAFASWTRAQQDAYCLENTGLAAILNDHKRTGAATVKAVPSEALDAARYRWLRSVGPEQQNVIAHYAMECMDERVDHFRLAAPLADKTGGGE